MNKIIPCMLPLMLLLGCDGQAELSSVNEINSNREAYMDDVVRLEGVLVESDQNMVYLSVGRLDYFTLEDNSGRMRVWYDIARRRCPPRLNAVLTVTGKVVTAEVVTTEQDTRPIFVARSISVDNEPPLAENEVRMCQLSLNEQQIHAEEGPQGLRDYWRAEGKPDRVLVYD